MATTKVITELTDLNQANSESGLRMPTGGAFSGTPVPGMMRNDTTQSSASSASTMQHYNGAEWKNFVNVDSCTLNKCDYPTTGTALYQFDDTADSSCTPAYNGTFTNPSYVASMTGFGKAADFNGSNTSINIGASNNFASDKLTISFWANPGTGNPSNYQLLFSNYIGQSVADYDFIMNRQTSQKLEVGISGAGSAYLYVGTDSAIFTTGTWKNYVIVFDTTESANVDKIKIYVNGTLEARSDIASSGTVTGSLLDTSDDLLIGDWPHDTTHIYSGLMDQVRIFSSALSPTDVTKVAGEVGC